MQESVRTPLSQFGLNRTPTNEKGFCFTETFQSNKSHNEQKKLLFPTPKFVASLKTTNENDSFSPKKNYNTKIVGIVEKKPLKKKIEVIEENPYMGAGVNEAESFSSLNDLDQDQKVFIDVQNANANNIFRQRKKDPDFREHNDGPIFNDGKVIKRSIVGKVDAFMKQHLIYNNKNTVDIVMPTKERKTSILKNQATLNKSQTSIQSMSSFDEGGPAGEPKKKKVNASAISGKQRSETETGKFHIMTKIKKDDLIQDIEKTEQRQVNNSKNDELLLNNLPPREKRFFTKEQRVLEKFQKTQDMWIKKTQAIAHKVKRKVDSCVMSKTDEFRLKLENAQTLDLLKNDDEKYGNNYWYLTLRDYPDSTARPETYTVFKKSKMNFNKNYLEIVRRNDEQHKSPRKILTAYGSNEYLNEKVGKNMKKLQIILPTDDNNFFTMQVVGTNKFESEVNFFRKDNFKSQLYFKKKPQKYEQNEICQETYAENYQDRDLFIKTGSNIFPKITSTFTF